MSSTELHALLTWKLCVCAVSMEPANVGVPIFKCFILRIVTTPSEQGSVYQVKNKIWERNRRYDYLMRGLNTERRARSRKKAVW